MSLKLNSSGGGSVTLQEPSTASNLTLTLPDATGTVQVSGNPISGTTGSFSGNLSFNSGYGSAAVAYGCRAWVNFNGTGAVAIRASGNVTSLTDNGTGDYTVNFTTTLVDANYAAATTVASTGGTNGQGSSMNGTPTSSAYRLTSYRSSTGATEDNPNVFCAIFR